MQDPDSGLPSDPTAWQAVCSGQARLKLRSQTTRTGTALRLEYDFPDAGGFVVARHALRPPLAQAHAVSFRIRGEHADNRLELKLVDTSGQNVWRRTWSQLRLTARARRIQVSADDLEFAWGPAGGGAPAALGAIEFAVVATGARRGWLAIEDLQIETRNTAPPPTLQTSFGEAAVTAAMDIDWQPDAANRKPWLSIDLHAVRTVGGLVLHWHDQAPRSGLRVFGSRRGNGWTRLLQWRTSAGARSYIALPNHRYRALRLELDEPSAGARIELQPAAFSRTPAAIWHAIAGTEVRGTYPRWLYREQCQWTVIGDGDGRTQALLDEDGRVEFGVGSALLEPMLWLDGHLVTWADVTLSPSLRDDWMPFPGVDWKGPDWQLRIDTESTTRGRLHIRYRFTHQGSGLRNVRLLVLLRPFQVTPPWQSVGAIGGLSPIRRLVWDGSAFQLNTDASVLPLTPTAAVGVHAFSEGDLVTRLARGDMPTATSVSDTDGNAQGVFAFDLVAAAGHCAEVVLSAAQPGETVGSDDPAFDWASALPLDSFRASGRGNDAICTLRTCLAHILATRNGPALQPGPRRYRRAWIRDATVMAAALLRFGHVDAVREFIDWYQDWLGPDGFVPCCVDEHGADTTIEHDSHGQWLALLADFHAFSPDPGPSDADWAMIARTVETIARLRDDSGLLPESASHEGYLAQPVHSYWDDGWALQGLRDIAALARKIGRAVLAQRCERLHAELADALFTSIETVRREQALDYIPGSREWADFDPSATAMMVIQLDLPPALNRGALERSYARYLEDWRRRRRGELDWANYSPYEIRIIAALVRMGWRDAALELLSFFLADRRPIAWHQWPEIAWRDPRAPGHLGDLPHTWIAAEYVLAVRSLFVYESPSQDALVLAGGVDGAWLDGDGIALQDAFTTRGPVSYRLRRSDATRLHFELNPGVRGRIILRPPLNGVLCSVKCSNATSMHWDNTSITLDAVNDALQIEIRTRPT